MGLRARILVALSLFLIFFAPSALADAIPVGVLSFDLLQVTSSGNLYGIDVFNGTQLGGGSQVSTFLNFTGLTLNVVLAGGGTSTIALTPTDAFGDFTSGALFKAGDFLSATLTASFSLTNVDLVDGRRVTIDEKFSSVLTNPAGPLQAGDLTSINANTRAQSVPEPSTLLLSALSLSMLAGLLRQRFRFSEFAWSARYR